MSVPIAYLCAANSNTSEEAETSPGCVVACVYSWFFFSPVVCALTNWKHLAFWYETMLWHEFRGAVISYTESHAVINARIRIWVLQRACYSLGPGWGTTKHVTDTWLLCLVWFLAPSVFFCPPLLSLMERAVWSGLIMKAVYTQGKKCLLKVAM